MNIPLRCWEVEGESTRGGLGEKEGLREEFQEKGHKRMEYKMNVSREGACEGGIPSLFKIELRTKLGVMQK